MTGFDRVLLADIGGTNARFALLNRGVIGPIERIKVEEHPESLDAIAGFLTSHVAGGKIEAAVLGVAGTVENNRCRVTTAVGRWTEAFCRRRSDFKAVRLLNDFEALAWSLPQLTAQISIRSARSPGCRCADAGDRPGRHWFWRCVPCFARRLRCRARRTEAGHATLRGRPNGTMPSLITCAANSDTCRLERALSGPGLEKTFTRHSRPSTASAFSPATQLQITQAALEGQLWRQPGSTRYVFCAMLGTVAGISRLDLLCPRWGVYCGRNCPSLRR